MSEWGKERNYLNRAYILAVVGSTRTRAIKVKREMSVNHV
jgi:hypothetical protein